MFKKILTISLILAFIFTANPIFTAEFNPNFIISDDEMQDWDSMNKTDIQAFLDYHGGYISNLRTLDAKDKKRSVSYIISEASKEYKINPKYLLVKLQKEQSLITDPDPTQKQLDWATGYSVCDNCSMNDPNIQKNKGFGKQVDSAAGIMRWYYDHVNTENWIKKPQKSYIIDNLEVEPVNLATAFLYTYTPHLQGNQNFWKLWQNWFKQLYPNGSLVKAKNDATVYLIQDSQKKPIKSMTALITRFDPKMILTVSDAELANYENGKEINLPNYSILKNGSKYYLLDYETLRPFENEELVKKMGYQQDEIIEITEEDIVGMPIGQTISHEEETPLGKIIKLKETGDIYLVKEEKYYQILDSQIAKKEFPNLKIETAKASELEKYESGGKQLLFRDGTLFGVKGTNKIYVVDNGFKRHIADEKVFLGLGYKWENVIWTNETVSLAYSNGQPLYLQTDNQESKKQTTTKNIITSTNNTQNNKTETANNQTNNSSNYQNLMVKTPTDKLSYVGSKIETTVDSYLVAEYPSGEIKAGKNIDTIRPMASFTKVLTAYHLLSSGLNLSTATTYDPAKNKSAYHQFRVSEGEQIKNSDLLDAMLVSSVNTATTMLVSNIKENEKEFVEEMNQLVKNWGLKNTYFADSYGYDIKNVTTAKEYLTIFSKGLENPEILKILGKKSYQYDEVLDNDNKPHHFDDNSNELIKKTGLNFKILASKTGYLYESGACLAMLIERNSDGKKFIIITMGNIDYENRFNEPKKIANWAIATF